MMPPGLCAPPLHWMDKEGDDRPRRGQGMEERVDQRRRHKALADCTLPEGFRLLTPIPCQVVTEGLLIYSFVLAYENNFNVGGPIYNRDVFFHVQRYEYSVQDDIQMEWALSDFMRDLREAGIDVVDTKSMGSSRVRTYGQHTELPLRGESKLAGVPVGPVSLGRCRGTGSVPARSTRSSNGVARAA